jgi:cytochrome c55X
MRDVVCFLCFLAALSTGAAAQEELPPHEHALVHLVRQDCGACHGMSLQGGLGSPLTKQALAGKPVDSLVATILQGRPGTAMPPWQSLLSEDEANWIVARLVAGFPEDSR